MSAVGAATAGPGLPRTLAAVVGVGAVTGAATLAYALWEAHQFTLRHVEVPVLSAGSTPLTLLHISDLHLTAGQEDKERWVRALVDLSPDFVIATGDFVSSAGGVARLPSALDPLLALPGAFVFGSNDYFAAKTINPMKYFAGPSKVRRRKPDLPTDQLRRGLTDAGWLDLNNAAGALHPGGQTVSLIGSADPHIKLDDYASVAGNWVPGANVKIGVVHAPYLRVLEAMAADGADLIIAGHTHGGQICLPGFGTLVTNCDLDRKRARGLSRYDDAYLHVSAGLGTNPNAPIRLACRPEATLMRLTARD